MKSVFNLRAIWKRISFGRRAMLTLMWCCFTTYNSYGLAIFAEDNRVENTTVLNLVEKRLLNTAIKEIVSNENKYREAFSTTNRTITNPNDDSVKVGKLKSLLDRGIDIMNTVEIRLEQNEEKERLKLGIWTFLEEIQHIPYTVTTTASEIMFEMKRHDCLNKKGVYLPMKETKNNHSLWRQYSDSIYVPFSCPSIRDEEQMSKASQTKREANPTKFVQVNLTMTNEKFTDALNNLNSSEYLSMTKKLRNWIDKTLQTIEGYKKVNNFSYWNGSVAVRFYVEIDASIANAASQIKMKLLNGIKNKQTGAFVFDQSSLATSEIMFDCPKYFTDDKGIFSSPILNGLYPKNKDCSWDIQVDVNHTIVVQFVKFDLEKDKNCKYDFVAIYDGDRFLRFCGNSTPPKSFPAHSYPFNSSNNSIKVRFKTDDNIEHLGFTAMWYKVLKYGLRMPKFLSQNTTTLLSIYNPWSERKNAAIPLSKASTCSKSLKDESCYFFGKQSVITRIISIFINRRMEITPSNPIVLNFEHILDENLFPRSYILQKTCVAWDQRTGTWTRRGCTTRSTNLTHTTCECQHTGMFAVLGEEERTEKVLNIKANVYFGLSVFVILICSTIYSLATQEKKTTGELFHLFEAIICCILVAIFLIGAHVSAEKELCGFLAFFLYYLLLSQFTWMLLTVFWIQNLLKKFLLKTTRIKIVYFLIGWGGPLLIAGIAGRVDVDKKGYENNVCWSSITDIGSVWSYGAPVFVIFLVNAIILFSLLLPVCKDQFHHNKLRPRIAKEILIVISSISTWCLAVKFVMDNSFPSQYFFCTFLIIQGAVTMNVSHEPTELFRRETPKREDVKEEQDEETEEGISVKVTEKTDVETTEKTDVETTEKSDVENQQPRMMVKTLRNLKIYKENGVFVIEA